MIFIEAEFGWTPREIDELYLDELIDRHSMLPTLKKHRVAEMAQAMRLARIDKQTKFDTAIESLLK